MAPRRLTVGLVVIVALSACGDDGDVGRPGLPMTYNRIDTSTDCTELQDEHETASIFYEDAVPGSTDADVSKSYMHAAEDRMRELGCDSP